MPTRIFCFCAASALLLFSLPIPAKAAALKSASITAIVNDVKVSNSGQGTRPAKLNESISGQSSVQTGLKSRTELLFSDNTLARLGANSSFSFTNGTRDIDLKQGTMLLQVPKGAGGAKITTAAVTAAITGTTIMIEYFPGGYSKVIVLEGTLRLFLTNRLGESILLEPGKMIILSPNATQLPEPVDVDLKRLVKTSKLIKAIDGTEIDLDIIHAEIDKQDKEKANGDLIGTNLVITGSGTEVILASEDLLNTLENASFHQQGENGPSDGSNPIPPGPTPPNLSKYQSLSTITSPNPYVINQTTTIITDPTITTDGITGEGTLYNSTIQPGNTSDFMFGETSAFDTASGFNTSFLGQDYGVFKFVELQIQDTPNIVTEGGPKNLFLISETNIVVSSSIRSEGIDMAAFSISEGPPPIAFNGLDFLGLVAMNGSIAISNPIIGPRQLDLYARGHGDGSYGEIYIGNSIELGSGGTFGAYAETRIGLSGSIFADVINMNSGDIIDLTSGYLQAGTVVLKAGGNIYLGGYNFDLPALSSLDARAENIQFYSSADFSGKTAHFIAAGSISGNESLLNATTLQASHDIYFYNTNSLNVSASGLVSAGNDIGVAGSLSAGNISAENNITTQNLTSAGNITAGGYISAANIIAADLLKAAEITSFGDISATNVQTTSGDLSVYSGSVTATSLQIAANIFISNFLRHGSNQSISVGGTVEITGGIHLAGSDGGNGGNLSLTAPSLFFGDTTGAISSASFDGGYDAGNAGHGGSLVATAASGNIEITSSQISASGGYSDTALGGNGGSVTLNSLSGAINHDGQLVANGGDSGGGQGGSGGSFTLQGNSVNIGSGAILSASGGSATGGSAEGGNGGSLTIISTGPVNLFNNTNLSTGQNAGVIYGGTGGTANITAGSHANITGTIKTSEDTVTGKLSKNGGKISVTSQETDTAKPGITISNTSQLLALLNAASNGKGGKIEFVSSGGMINVAGTVDAGKKGGTGTSGTDGLLYMANNANNGKINILNTANLRADVIKAEVLGTNGVLTINGGGAGGLTADSQIRLMANSSTGSVVFTGGVINLTSPEILINAHTVTVTGDTRVNNNGATTVGAVNHNYANGVGPSGLGGFRDPVTQTAP